MCRQADHVIDVGVVDDTSTKHLVDSGSPAGGSVVVQIMNTVRSLHVHWRANGHRQSKSIPIPTPYNTLEASKTEDLYGSYLSTSLVSSAGAGSYFTRLGFPSQPFGKSTWCTSLMVGDALKANDTSFY